MASKRLSLLALFLLLAGCTLAPRYERPAAPVSADWPAGPAYRPSEQPAAQAAAEVPWQSFFVDPQLQTLIARALEINRDLRVAVLNIERSRVQYRIERSELHPHLDGTAAYSARRSPSGSFGSNPAVIIRQYSAGLGVSAYELDLFGRVRSLKNQSLEQFLATEQARRSVQISLVFEVAVRHLTLAADSERLQLARETLDKAVGGCSL